MEKLSSKFSFFQAPFLAFFSGDLYRDVAENWKGSGVLYIFLLSSAAWVISCIATIAVPMLQASSNQDVRAVLQQLPKIQITGGKLTIDKPAGYEVKETATGSTIIRFATDRKTDEPRDGDPPFVLTETALIYQLPGSYRTASDDDPPEPKVVKFAEVQNLLGPEFTMDGASAQSMIAMSCTVVPVLILFIAWPFIFLGHLFQLLVFGGIGMLVANAMQKDLTFEKSMRLAAIAISPAVIVTVILNLLLMIATLNPETPMYAPVRAVLSFWGITSVGLTAAYLILIMRALSNSNSEAQPVSDV